MKILGDSREAVLAAAVLAVIGTVAYFRTSRTAIGSLGTTGTLGAVASQTFDATTRRQVIGDTAVIEKGIRTGWSEGEHARRAAQ